VCLFVVGGGTSLAALGLSRFRGARIAPTARGGAFLGTALLGGLVAVSGFRLADRPGLDEYLMGVEHIASLGPLGERVMPGPPFGPEEYTPGIPGERRDPVGAVTLIRVCEEDGCRIGLVDAPEARISPEILAGGPIQYWGEYFDLLKDRRRGVIYSGHLGQECAGSGHFYLINLNKLLGAPPSSGRLGGLPCIVAEFEHVDGQWLPRNFDVANVARGAHPPLEWVLVGGVGLLLVAALWVGRVRAVRRDHWLATARAGNIGADGWVSLKSSPPMRMDPALDVPPGPVLVLGNIAATAYRDQQALSAKDVLSGALAEHKERAAFHLLRYDTAIVAVAFLAAAPLAAAAMVGLVI